MVQMFIKAVTKEASKTKCLIISPEELCESPLKMAEMTLPALRNQAWVWPEKNKHGDPSLVSEVLQNFRVCIKYDRGFCHMC